MKKKDAIILSLCVMIYILAAIFAVNFKMKGQKDVVKVTFNTLPDNKDVLYASVEIQRGDTLYSMVDNFMNKYDYCGISKIEIVQTIVDINSINPDRIHAGNYVIIPYVVDKEPE